MSDRTAEHYDRLADRFDANWAYSSEFVSWMSARIVDRLTPRPSERVLDLGCGTGLYARCLAEQAGRVVCVDPSAGMLEQLPAGEPFIAVQAAVEDLTAGAVTLPHERFDAVLAKEVLHHVPRGKRPDVLRGLALLLAPGGRLLLVLLPSTIDYPLFDSALRRFERHPIDPADVAAVLETARLRTEVTSETFRLVLDKARWLAMVRGRYMSLLATFDDEELEAGITEIDTRYPGPLLEFDDRFIFILARR